MEQARVEAKFARAREYNEAGAAVKPASAVQRKGTAECHYYTTVLADVNIVKKCSSVARLAAALGAEAFAEAFAAGQQLALEEAFAAILAPDSSRLDL